MGLGLHFFIRHDRRLGRFVVRTPFATFFPFWRMPEELHQLLVAGSIPARLFTVPVAQW